MPIPVRVSRLAALLKAPHGSPCTRCGVCCSVSLCGMGRRTFNRPELPGPCPALLGSPGNAACGLVADPARFAPDLTDKHGIDAMSAAAKMLIGDATGCDARINGEPTSHEFNHRMEQWDRDNVEAIASARKLWRMT